MTSALRGLLLAAVVAGGCAHDDLVVAGREGAAPGRVERPAALRRHLRERARAVRRTPYTQSFFPSGAPAIQRALPWYDELVDGARLGRPGGPASDAGGPIKAHGEHLVVLRDDRVLVVSTGEPMRVVATAAIDHAYDSSLLVHGDQVIVVATRLRARTGPPRTTVHRFTIAADGRLTPRPAVVLRAPQGHVDDLARVVGDTLILHLQSPLGARTPDLLGLPQIRRAGRWQPLVRAADLQRPVAPATSVHTVVRCSLGPRMDCEARGVVAPATMFLTFDDEAVVAWTGARSGAAVWRFPADGGPATAVRVPGQPLDLLAWRLERGDLDAVVRTDAVAGGLARLRIPAAELRAGLTTIAAAELRSLAWPHDEVEVAARFVGDHVLLADTPDWACDGATTLHVYPLAGGAPTRLAVPHCVGRIEPLGDHALALGAPDDGGAAPVHITPIDLRGAPVVGETRVYTDVDAGRLRAFGPFRLGESRRGLLPRGDAPLRVITVDGPRVVDVGAAPGGGRTDHAFSHAGRLFMVRADHLVELTAAGDALLERRRVALDR